MELTKRPVTMEAERESRGNIFSSMTDAVKSKLTQATDVVEETRAAREHGSTGRTVPVERVEINIEETRPGAIAETLKTADQMTGQTFNDVGRIDDEGTIRIERKEDRYGKM
ncbi:hypothetical protein Patl1_32309 [Pistacia atlantica]|uniref:Uncharacterized protein n=1 Tax=Pistacia atlantica TaxID=434234 RepID=A0ACC1AQZ6_9ROSI|nr:hypothetical protein Patl1_32309 [Pistacia atlantica]